MPWSNESSDFSCYGCTVQYVADLYRLDPRSLADLLNLVEHRNRTVPRRGWYLGTECGAVTFVDQEKIGEPPTSIPSR
jgi:hypothetical protein